MNLYKVTVSLPNGVLFCSKMIWADSEADAQRIAQSQIRSQTSLQGLLQPIKMNFKIESLSI